MEDLDRHLRAARDCLQGGEGDIPEPVRQTIAFLAGAGVWFRLSRNPEAQSCRDAANKRDRLGHIGIPLWDELKSFCGSYVERGGQRRLLMAHCRGDEVLDMDALARALGAIESPIRLEGEDLLSLGMAYGLVNPFTLYDPSRPLDEDRSLPVQVFDEGLLRPLGVPGTMMTNAGDLTWAVEFSPRELVAAIPGARVDSIAEPDPEESPRPRRMQGRAIGIITGNGPESGIALWNHVNAALRDLLGRDYLGDVSMPPVVVHSLPEMGLSMELDARAEQVWATMGLAVEQMCMDGVRALAVACNTTHYFTPRVREICARHDAEFISMPECIAQWLRARGVDRLALLGIKYVTELDEWSAYREPFAGMQVERLGPRGIERIHDLAYRVKTKGASPNALSQFRDLLHKEVSARYVVVALTELSLLLREKWRGEGGKILIDPLAIYGEAIARRWLGLPFPAPPKEGA